MVEISFIIIAIIFIIIWTIYRIRVFKKSESFNKKREVFISLFFIYFLILVNLTIFKQGMLMLDFEKRVSVNFIPVVATVQMFKNNFYGISMAFYNVIGNILLFIPLGFGIPLFFSSKNKIGKVILYGSIASLTIEVLQYFTSRNITDVDDIIFNTLGAVLGFIAFNVIYNLIKNTKIGTFVKSLSSSFDGNLVWVAVRPIGIMILVTSILSFGLLYSVTASGKLSNEQLALEVIGGNSIGGYEAAREFQNYKLFLLDNDNFMELRSVKRILNNRWYQAGCYENFQKEEGDYYISTIYNDSTLAVIAFGKNKEAKTIKITFNNNEYIAELKGNEYFIAPFPTFEAVDINSDIYNIFSGEESRDLKVEFYDDNGDIYTDMKFARYKDEGQSN